MSRISKNSSTPRPILFLKRRTRALILGGLGLIPAACQSPVARFIPVQATKELKVPATHFTPKAEGICEEIKEKTGKQSIALTAIKSWVKGVGLSGYSLACLPMLSSADVSMAGISSKHGGRFRSSISGAIEGSFNYKIPSYTSGSVDNDETKRVRSENKKIEEEEKTEKK